MKFNCGKSTEEKAEASLIEAGKRIIYLENWHRVFVIWPRRIASGDCRFLESVERKYRKVWHRELFNFRLRVNGYEVIARDPVYRAIK